MRKCCVSQRTWIPQQVKWSHIMFCVQKITFHQEFHPMSRIFHKLDFVYVLSDRRDAFWRKSIVRNIDELPCRSIWYRWSWSEDVERSGEGETCDARSSQTNSFYLHTGSERWHSGKTQWTQESRAGIQHAVHGKGIVQQFYPPPPPASEGWGRYCFHRCLSFHTRGGGHPSPGFFLRSLVPVPFPWGTNYSFWHFLGGNR